MIRLPCALAVFLIILHDDRNSEMQCNVDSKNDEMMIWQTKKTELEYRSQPAATCPSSAGWSNVEPIKKKEKSGIITNHTHHSFFTHDEPDED